MDSALAPTVKVWPVMTCGVRTMRADRLLAEADLHCEYARAHKKRGRVSRKDVMAEAATREPKPQQDTTFQNAHESHHTMPPDAVWATGPSMHADGGSGVRHLTALAPQNSYPDASSAVHTPPSSGGGGGQLDLLGTATSVQPYHPTSAPAYGPYDQPSAFNAGRLSLSGPDGINDIDHVPFPRAMARRTSSIYNTTTPSTPEAYQTNRAFPRATISPSALIILSRSWAKRPWWNRQIGWP